MKIFVSYRRDDAAGWIKSLGEKLRRRFGRKHVFIDVDDIRDFENFESRILQTIDECDIVLAVIGLRWTTIRDKNGERRLDLPSDYVRAEIARALRVRVPVLPILVDGATLPKPEELPSELKELLLPNVHLIRSEHLDEDIAALLRRIDRRPSSRRLVLLALLSFISGVLTALVGSALARRFLSTTLPDGACLDASRSGGPYALYAPQGYPLDSGGETDAYQHHAYQDDARPQPNADTGQQVPYRDATPGSYQPGYGYQPYGYRGAIGGGLL